MAYSINRAGVLPPTAPCSIKHRPSNIEGESGLTVTFTITEERRCGGGGRAASARSTLADITRAARVDDPDGGSAAAAAGASPPGERRCTGKDGGTDTASLVWSVAAVDEDVRTEDLRVGGAGWDMDLWHGSQTRCFFLYPGSMTRCLEWVL